MISRDAGDSRLEAALARIWETAVELGLDPLPTHFEVVPAPVIYELGAYGIPGRFSHWSHGKAFQHMKTAYDYGLIRIYELVINTDPCQAFLVDSNSPLQNTFVMAHVLGHSDFFHHNAYFRRTHRGMAERAALHAGRIKAYEYHHGSRAVEEFLDAVLAVEGHVDPWLGEDGERVFKSGRSLGPREGEETPTPADPDQDFAHRDLLLYLLHHAPNLEDWQRDVLASVRAERLYFVPQIRTKIINEGWATFWHARIMRALDLPDHEYTDFARLHAGVLGGDPLAVNPYALGLALFEHLEQQVGLEGLREIRDLNDDVSFLRNYLTPELARELGLFLYRREKGRWVVGETDPERVIEVLIQSRLNCGLPVIRVVDGDHRGRRELYLKHEFDGRELHIGDARRTLAHVRRLWGRPVHLETVTGGEKQVLVSRGDDDEREGRR